MKFLHLVGFALGNMDDAIRVLFTFSMSAARQKNPFHADSAGNLECIQNILRVSGCAESDDGIPFSAHDKQLLGKRHKGIHIVAVSSGKRGLGRKIERAQSHLQRSAEISRILSERSRHLKHLLRRNRTFQQSRFPWYFLTGALGVALAILELATSSASRETPPPSMEALAQLPVLSGVVAEEPERALTTQGKTPLGAAYAYREWEGSNSLYSAYCRGAFPSLADALYQEALGGFLPARYRHTDMEPISIPGYDQAAQSTDGRTLALQRGLEVYLIDYDPAYFSQGEILALLPRMYGD